MWDMWLLDRTPRAESKRDRWEFEPFDRVGPLRFGMAEDEVLEALAGADARLHRNRDTSRCLLFADAGVNAYFDAAAGLACVAIDAFDGPQVIAPDGFALAGRLPSQARPWFMAQVDHWSTQWVVNEYCDAGLVELGLVMRIQRGGDVNLTRPLFVAKAWLGMLMHTDEGRIPECEWRRVL